uniref:Uncharacterized protein n=1 Tax=Aegilops tauschii subsp. strangulata TaxID=200361 RepID=A0A453C7Y5_AEGTS
VPPPRPLPLRCRPQAISRRRLISYLPRPPAPHAHTLHASSATPRRRRQEVTSASSRRPPEAARQPAPPATSHPRRFHLSRARGFFVRKEEKHRWISCRLVILHIMEL